MERFCIRGGALHNQAASLQEQLQIVSPQINGQGDGIEYRHSHGEYNNIQKALGIATQALAAHLANCRECYLTKS